MTTHAVEGILQTDDTKMTLIALHGMCTSTSVSRNNSYPPPLPIKTVLKAKARPYYVS